MDDAIPIVQLLKRYQNLLHLAVVVGTTGICIPKPNITPLGMINDSPTYFQEGCDYLKDTSSMVFDKLVSRVLIHTMTPHTYQ